MCTPEDNATKLSLKKLKDQSILYQSDIKNITRIFIHDHDQSGFLSKDNLPNRQLAETLLIFQQKLNEAKNTEQNLTSLIDQVFLHYVINTDGPISEAAGVDVFDVFDAATSYAATLSIGVRDSAGNSILEFDGKEIPCPAWKTSDKKSAAKSLREVGPVINRIRYGRDDVIPSTTMTFREKRKTYSLENAMILADCAHLAYLTPNYVKQQLGDWKYQRFHWIEDQDTDTQVFVVEKDNHLVISFRGTSSGRDALIDLKFFRTSAFGGIGRVHRGFKKALDSVWDQLKNVVASFGKQKRLFVCGHSLGAALAQLAAYRLALSGATIAGVYVYGSPRIGNKNFREAYNERLKKQTFLHINNTDIVTKAPPKLLGYHHLGTTPRTFDEGHNIERFKELIEDTIREDLEFEDLDSGQQATIRENISHIQTSLSATTKYMGKPPEPSTTINYESNAETGAIDEHSMDQYLFKLGCAIIDNR